MKTIVTIAVASALAIGHDAAAQPTDHGVLRLILVVCGMLITCLTAKLVVLTCVSEAPAAPLTARIAPRPAIQQQLERLHLAVWLIVGAFLVFVVDWVTLVRTNWQLQNCILVDEFVILIPFTLPWLISWALFYDLQHDADDAASRWNFVGHNARLVFGIGLLPVLLVCAVADTAYLVDPRLVNGSLAPAIFTTPLLAMLLTYPYILRALWRTSTLPTGPLRERLENISLRHRISINDILIWHTDHRVCNAAVTGMLPGLRYVFLTDGLLADLSDEEIAAVFAHELGHVRHRHLQKRMLALLLPVTACVLLTTLGSWPNVDSTVCGPPLSNTGFTYVLLAMTIAYMVFVMGWYSRNLEHEADVWACQHLHAGMDSESSQRAYFSALRRIAAGQSIRRKEWLHPSYAQRKQFLLQTTQFPGKYAVFCRTMRFIGWGLYAATALGIASLVMRQY